MSVDDRIPGPWDLVVVGHGFAGLSAPVAFVESWPGTAPRVAVIHRGLPGERGSTTATRTRQEHPVCVRS